MKTIILIRHGSTEFLEDNGGSKLPNDSLLSSQGEKEIRKLKEWLTQYQIDKVASSLYARARQTASMIIEGTNLKIFLSANLNEYFVAHDGCGLETVEDVLCRIDAFLIQVRQTSSCLAVVSHQSFMSTFLQQILNLTFSDSKNYFLKPGSAVVLRYDLEKGDQNWRIVNQFSPA